jgi:glycosyltransferase involved in cell wall biosynthesis
MLSFIIPAHNEEHWIAKCLSSIRAAMQRIAEPYELIVVDDASNDATPKIAHQLFHDWQQPTDDQRPTTSASISQVVRDPHVVRGSDVVRGSPDPAQASTAGLQSFRILPVDLRRISAVRNAGARLATGDIFFFVDADTQANEPAIRAALAALRGGATGGGCAPEFTGPIPWWARLIISFSVMVARRIRLVGGCFQFCTRDAYDAIGGYDETLRAGEDMAFCYAIKKVGRFVVPGPTVVTSARKLNVVSPWQVISLLVTIMIRGPRYERPWIFDILYGDRAQAARKPTEV